MVRYAIHHSWSDSDDETPVADEQELEYSSDDEEENEPPHPLGFGQSRYALEPKESLEAYKRRMGYSYPFEEDDWLLSPDYKPRQQTYPPLDALMDVPTHILLQFTDHARATAEEEDAVERLTQRLGSTAVKDRTAPRPQPVLSPEARRAAVEAYRRLGSEQGQVDRELDQERRKLDQEHVASAKKVQAILKKQLQQAEQIQQEQTRLQEQLDRQVQEQRRVDAERRKADQEQKERDDAEVERRRQVQADAERRQGDQERAAKEAAAKERDYIVRAQKLVAQLVQVRASVEPFDKSPHVKKRRLHMKKLVGGKINTLTENADKVREVANEVSRAIAAERDEDERVKQAIAAGNRDVPPETARGKRYLVDLLSSKVIVRVQAEGFNGQRGDGFPLAAMLALVSTDNKDIGLVLAAHIYTVCPTAIPSLPDPSPTATEEELMESLGMQKKPDGTFETFERFLQRTESIISLVSNIMASMPPTHNLLGGHESAIKWLSRFLALLPSAPESPLPLVTAPVLDAFLTGAGHMLANKHADAFSAHLDTIMNDVSNRLDESPVGAPSATRLRKTVAGGFQGFKNNLPSRALPQLYYGADPSSATGHGSSASATGISFAVSTGSTFPGSTESAPSPFGGGGSASSVPSPFGKSTTSVASPFGSSGGPLPSSSTSTSNPFGASPAPAGGGSPFGSSGQSMSDTPFSGAPAPAASPFTQSSQPGSLGFGSSFPGSQGASPFQPSGSMSQSTGTGASPFSSVPGPSPFSRGAAQSSFSQLGPASNPSPFGAPAPSPSQFGGPAPAPTPFGSNAMPSSSPFGGPAPFGAAAPAPAAFGQPSPFGAAPSQFNQASPFGGSAAPASSSSPFGAPAPSTPFGSSSGSSPFGQSASSPSPFGSSGGGFNQQSRGGGGGGKQQRSNKPPCKYFAEGRCRFGDNCRFSHETGGGASNSFNNPFGGPRR